MADEGDDVMYGDGFFGVLLFTKPHPTNKDLIICMMKPASLTKKAFGLDDADPERDRITGAYAKEYKKRDMKPFNRWKYGRSWLFYCDWNGKRTDFIETLRLEAYDKIEYLAEDNRTLRRIILKIMKDRDKNINQPEILEMKAEERYLKHYKRLSEEETEKTATGEGQYG